MLLLPDHQELARVADDGTRRAGGARGEQRARGTAFGGDQPRGGQGLLVEAVGAELDRADWGERRGVDLSLLLFFF